jgi:phosphate-selective porin
VHIVTVLKTIELRPLLIAAAFVCVLVGVATPAGAQAGLNDPATGDDPPAAESTPTPSPTPPPDVNAEEEEIFKEHAEKVAAQAEAREGTVPEEEVEASSDRIMYRDQLDIEEEPMKKKWDRFIDALSGLTHYSFFDSKLRFRLGLRFQADGTLVAASDQLEQNVGDLSNSVDFRRFRLFAEGIYRMMYFRAEFDFAEDAGFKSLYLEGRKGGLAVWGVLLGKFRYGLFQEPFGLEQNVSSYDTSFVEFSLPSATFAPGANLGAMVYDASANRRWNWAVGAFSVGQTTADNQSNSTLSVTGRGGFRPIMRDDGRHMLHVGLSLSTRSPQGSDIRYQSRPEARFVDPLISTGFMPSNQNHLFGLEAAWKRGGFWSQAELIRATVATPEGDLDFGGFTFHVGWFPSGLSRPWDGLNAIWGRVRPKHRYSWGNPVKDKGGVWEVVGRFSTSDLRDGYIEGGEMWNATGGINWYLGAMSKLQFNWVHSRVDGSGYANIWILRYQFAVQ